jgi:hypothetical protein
MHYGSSVAGMAVSNVRHMYTVTKQSTLLGIAHTTYVKEQQHMSAKFADVVGAALAGRCRSMWRSYRLSSRQRRQLLTLRQR